MKIYVLTQGSYSDYSIVGVYTSMKNWEEARSKCGDANDVEVYEADEYTKAAAKGLVFFSLTMDCEGNVLNSTVHDSGPDNRETAAQPGVAFVPGPRYKFVIRRGAYFKSQKHAVKALNEKRLALIASGELDRWFDAYSKQYNPGQLFR